MLAAAVQCVLLGVLLALQRLIWTCSRHPAGAFSLFWAGA